MEIFIGQIVLFPYTFTPQGFLPCQGQLLPVQQNLALFSLLGKRFGGDGMTSFGLPNYGKLAPEGSTYCIAIEGVFPQQ